MHTADDSIRSLDFDLVSGELAGAAAGRTALLHSRLFWPTFQEIDGVVLLEGAVEDEADREVVRSALARNGGDRSRVEQEFNFHELGSLFGGLVDVTQEGEEWLAARVAEMWHARLREQFPDRSFSVAVVRPEATDGHELGVLFHSV